MRAILLVFFISNLIAIDLSFQKAEKYFFEKKYDLANPILKKIVIKKPNHPKAYALLGDIALHKKKYNLALKYYQKASKISKNPSQEYFRIGQVYIQLDQSINAEKAFNNSYLLDPSFKIALFQKGYTSLVLDRNKANTITNWQQFVDEAPEDPQTPKVEAILKLLRNPDFKIPSRDSDISLEEALLLGGKTIRADHTKTKDKTAGHEKAKTSNKTSELLDDNGL